MHFISDPEATHPISRKRAQIPPPNGENHTRKSTHPIEPRFPHLGLRCTFRRFDFTSSSPTPVRAFPSRRSYHPAPPPAGLPAGLGPQGRSVLVTGISHIVLNLKTGFLRIPHHRPRSTNRTGEHGFRFRYGYRLRAGFLGGRAVESVQVSSCDIRGHPASRAPPHRTEIAATVGLCRQFLDFPARHCWRTVFRPAVSWAGIMYICSL